MKFVVSSTELLKHLNAISRVINAKNSLPILDNFLFELSDGKLVITASDLETTLIATFVPDRFQDEGSIAIPSKILMDTLKEFPEQPLTFSIDTVSQNIEILSETGKYQIVGHPGTEYPNHQELDEGANVLNLAHDVLLKGIEKTIFATGDDELRPVMNGIFVEFAENSITFVASDAHKLVRYRRTDIESSFVSSIILPKKPAALLKGLLPKEDFDVQMQFDKKNVYFSLTDYQVICRQVEGKFPAYQSVIPQNNTNIALIDRRDFYNALKRVSVFANPSSNLVKFEIANDELILSAQDVDFAQSGVEHMKCSYSDREIAIGFKATFLLEILNNIESTEIRLELSDPTRAGVIFPADTIDENEDVLMLLMPMMVN